MLSGPCPLRYGERMDEPAPCPWIVEATPESFGRLVLENSHKGPVLVNYWARYAGPCLRLWPVLERLARDYGGRFLLANLDCGRHAAFARGQGVTSLPLLRLYRDGEVRETVHGYEGEQPLRRLLDRHVPRPSDRAAALALRRLEAGEHEAALAGLREALAADPGNPRLPVAYAKALIRAGRAGEAAAWIAGLPRALREREDLDTLRGHAAFLAAASDAPDEGALRAEIAAAPGAIEPRFRLAAVLLRADRLDEALETLLETLRACGDTAEHDVLRGLVALFRMLGPDDPRVRRLRPQVAELLGRAVPSRIGGGR